jgi:hypothetical protein
MASDDRRNVRISFWNRVKTELHANYPVKFDGLDFDTAIQTAWYEPKMLDGIDGQHRIGSRNEKHLFQIDVYTKTGPDEETPLKILELEGLVYVAFRDYIQSIKDWDADGNPHSVYMRYVDWESGPGPVEDEHEMRTICKFAGIINE